MTLSTYKINSKSIQPNTKDATLRVPLGQIRLITALLPNNQSLFITSKVHKVNAQPKTVRSKLKTNENFCMLIIYYTYTVVHRTWYLVPVPIITCTHTISFLFSYPGSQDSTV